MRSWGGQLADHTGTATRFRTSKGGLIVLAAAVLIGGWGGEVAAQERANGWSFGVEGGRHTVHRHGEGAVVGLIAARPLGQTFALQLHVLHGTGDSFTVVEPEIIARLRLTRGLHGIVGAGGGPMLEGSLSASYFARAGLGVRLSRSLELQATYRVGSHVNFGDSGRFEGPNIVSIALLVR